jgi:hypothetical protein
MINQVTKRFIECHNKVLELKKVRSSRQFALMLDYLPQSLSEILKERRDVTLELVRKAAEVFNISPVYLFMGKGEFFYEDKMDQVRELTMVTNIAGESKIIYVPAGLQSRYASNKFKAHIMEELPVFSLPDQNYNSEHFRCFEVVGDQMEPTLYEGERVVGRYVEPMFWNNGIKDNMVFVLVTKSDVHIGRAINHLKETKSILFTFDNSYFKSMQIPKAEIQEVWQIALKISPFLASPRNPNDLFKVELEQIAQANKFFGESLKDLEQKIRELIRRENRHTTI